MADLSWSSIVTCQGWKSTGSTNKNNYARTFRCTRKWGTGGLILHHNCCFPCETSLSLRYPSDRAGATLIHGHQSHINPFVTPWGRPQSTLLTQTLSHPTASCGRPFSQRQHPPPALQPHMLVPASLSLSLSPHMQPEEAKAVPDGSPRAFVVKQPLLLSFSFGLSASVHLVHIDAWKNLAWRTEVDSFLEQPRQLPYITPNQSGSKQLSGNKPRLLSTNHLYWGWQIGASQKLQHLLWIAICRCFGCDFWRSVRWSSPDMFCPWMKSSFIRLLSLQKRLCQWKGKLTTCSTLHTPKILS